MTLTQARASFRTRRSRYVVGYVGAGNLIYARYPAWDAAAQYPHPMTLRQAETRLATMPCAGCAIFELVPVAINR